MMTEQGTDTPECTEQRAEAISWLSPDVPVLGLWFVPSHDLSHQGSV